MVCGFGLNSFVQLATVSPGVCSGIPGETSVPRSAQFALAVPNSPPAITLRSRLKVSYWITAESKMASK